MNRDVFPRAPHEITAEWLTQVLRASGITCAYPVARVETEVIGDERGFTGVIARLKLTFDSAGKDVPDAVIAKFPLAERALESSYRRAQAPAGGVSRKMAERAAREVDFYRAVGTELPQVPHCYYAYADVAAGEVILLLEDLSAGVPGDALAGCSVEEARSVLAAIRTVHAHWWREPALPSLDWVGEWSAMSNRRVARYRSQTEAVIRAYGERLPNRTVDLMRALVEPFERILAGLAAAPETLIHADLHLDNVMFVPEDDAYQVKLIDWQSPSRGAAMLDVAGFIAESLTIADRRAHEVELLRGYHDGLLAAGVDGYAFDDCFDDYSRALCVRMTGQVGWLARVVDDQTVGRERALVEAVLDPGNVFVALLDHEVIARLS